MSNFANFRAVIAACKPQHFHDEAASNAKLLISHKSDRVVQTYYAPFDHVNTMAKLVLVGITPGREQMNKALQACCTQLHAGRSDSEALAAAKRAASFGGEMRDTLVNLLNRYNFHQRFGLRTTSQLWDEGNDIAHFTSALRNPVFRLDGDVEKNYTGGSPTLATYTGFKETLKELRSELMSIEDALILPLGDKVAKVIQALVTSGDIPLSRVLNHDGKVAEFPHPSGANRESQNLVLEKDLPSAQDYAQSMLRKYLAKKASEGERVSPEQEKRYLGTRHSYWKRAVHSRAALNSITA